MSLLASIRWAFGFDPSMLRDTNWDQQAPTVTIEIPIGIG